MKNTNYILMDLLIDLEANKLFSTENILRFYEAAKEESLLATDDKIIRNLSRRVYAYFVERLPKEELLAVIDSNLDRIYESIPGTIELEILKGYHKYRNGGPMKKENENSIVAIISDLVETLKSNSSEAAKDYALDLLELYMEYKISEGISIETVYWIKEQIETCRGAVI